jgi:hypothetical protein
MDLSEASLLDAATTQARGLSDWGPGEFLPALRRLLSSIEAEANLSPRGRELCRAKLVHHLVNRLEIQAALTTEADAILRQRIVRPLMVVGFPRTGSTLLHTLLSLDPRARSLKFWELYSPYPLTRELAADEPDPRMVAANAFIATRNQKIQRAHELKIDAPEECNWLLQNTFAQWRFYMFFRIPSYHAWLVEQNLHDEYQYYRKQIQLLLWQRPCPDGGHLVLKNPNHFGFMNALLAAFPDACMVHVHRDMRSVIGSTCSARCANHQTYSDSVDKRAVGAEVVAAIARFTERGMEARAAAARPAQFLDLRYDDFVRSPLETIRRIYSHFGLELLPEFETRVADWLLHDARAPKHRHEYDLGEFGLDDKTIEATFARYIERFDVR